jgi:hypothetical protein
MENNGFIGELPAEVLDPNPELTPRTVILVRMGVSISLTVVIAALNDPPDVEILRTQYGMCGYYISLALLFLGGIGLTVLCVFTTNGSGDYRVAMRLGADVEFRLGGVIIIL